MTRRSLSFLALFCSASIRCGGDEPGRKPAGFTVRASPPVASGVPFTVTVVAVNARGDAVPTYAGALHLTSSDPEATLPASAAMTASNGGRVDIQVTLKTRGPQTLTVTDDGGLAGTSAGWNVDGVRLLATGGKGDSMCAALESGGLKCWGDNDGGQLGVGDSAARGQKLTELSTALPAVSLGTGRTVTAVGLGSYHTCAILDDDALKCWGPNTYGELGLGDYVPRGAAPDTLGAALPASVLGVNRTAHRLALGPENSCVLLDTGAVKCFGNNDFGELGVGDTVLRGGVPESVGDTQPSVALGTGRTAERLTFGGQHACVVLDTHQIKCWGRNDAGGLGLGDTTQRGDLPTTAGDNLPTVALGTGRTATQVHGGADYTCALLDNAQVKCWGHNGDGQLGVGDTFNRGDAPGQMGDALPTVRLGAGRSVRSLAVGSRHVCALLDNSATKCWGSNASGGLGAGDTLSRGGAAGGMGDALTPLDIGAGGLAVEALSAGAIFNCALLEGGQVKCWGDNAHGQLALGDTQNRGASAGTMGSALPASPVW
jgi:alpha-tubulin suppressor-like RCC1 family protein